MKLAAWSLAVWLGRTDATFYINALFSNGMVLQTSLDGGVGAGILTGTAKPGSKTLLEASAGFPSAGTYTATTGDDGVWKIAIADHVDKDHWGPFSLTLSNDASPGTTYAADDVYFGDVYLCGGQSNMERAVNTIDNKTAEFAEAEHSDIRLFAVPKRHDAQPPLAATPSETLSIDGSCLYGDSANPCDSPVRTWRRANVTWVQHFSAICYLTARDVARDRGTLGKGGRAIGLIESDVGGTPVQAWTPPEGLQACGALTNNCTTEPNGDCLNYPSALFNTMISPVVGRGLRAFLWMQGEANSDEGFPMSRAEYACGFGEMITAWRSRWSGAASVPAFNDIPFLFVQISSWYGNWGFDNLPCTANYCPVITRTRLAQADVAGIGNASLAYMRPHVGMAVSADSGDTTGVHSRYKSEPARRLSWQVRAKAFGESAILPDPPVPDFTHGAATWDFDATGHAVVTMPLAGFAQGGVSLVGSNKCDEVYSKECCAGAGLVTARVCVAQEAETCETDNQEIVFDAAMALGADQRSLVLTTVNALPSGSEPRWLDMFRSDFPLCVVLDSERSLAMSAFAYLPLVRGSAHSSIAV